MQAQLICVAIVTALCSPLAASAAEAPVAVEHARIVQGCRNDDVLRLQVLLDRAHFGPGEIDGVFGSNVAKAVAGFQRSRGLDDTGALDEATWAELQSE